MIDFLKIAIYYFFVTKTSSKGTMIREMVNELRSAGVPICSDRNGYYIAKSREELDRTIVQLKSRVKKIQSAIEGLEAVRM